MHELIADLFISLDGYAAGENTPGYFGMLGRELEARIREHADEPQEIVMGRRTYEVLAHYATASEGTDETARRMDELPEIVLSHTLRNPLPWTPARVIGGDLAEVVGDLKRRDGPVDRQHPGRAGPGRRRPAGPAAARRVSHRARRRWTRARLRGGTRAASWSSSTAPCSKDGCSPSSTGRHPPRARSPDDARSSMGPMSLAAILRSQS